MSTRKYKRFVTNFISAIALLILDKNMLSNVFGFPMQCRNYNNLAEKNRYVKNQPARLPLCDHKISKTGWYRFINRAGSILSTSQVKTGLCSAQNPGRLIGDHPCTIYQSTDAQVCFVNQNDSCGTKVNISITLCGKYYVYRLQAINCSDELRRRYCGEESKVPVPSCNISDTPVYPTTSFTDQTTSPGESYKNTHLIATM